MHIKKNKIKILKSVFKVTKLIKNHATNNSMNNSDMSEIKDHF